MSDAPTPSRDPRLEIPEVLRTPVKKPELPTTSAGRSGGNSLGDVGIAIAIGIDFLGVLGAGALVGYFLGKWLGAAPIGLVSGVGLGFVWATFRIIKRLNAQDRKK